MNLNTILNSFTKVQGQLQDFIADNKVCKKALHTELDVVNNELDKAAKALKQINKVVGK